MNSKRAFHKIAISLIIVGFLLSSAGLSAGESEFISATPPSVSKQTDTSSSQQTLPASGSSSNFLVGPGVINVTVTSQVLWVNTGVFVNAGDQLSISATGSWNPGSPATGPVGPEGSSLSWPDNFLNLTDIGTCMYCAQTQTPFWASLIGYIGNTPPGSGSYTSTSVIPEGQKIFFVGNQFNNSVPSTGTLWLNFNDDAYSGYTVDNSGSVNVTIGYSATRQDLINAYARLRDEIKLAMISDRNLVAIMDTDYVKAISPDWGKLAFQEVIDLSVRPESFGVYGLTLTKMLEPFHYLNTGVDMGIGVYSVMNGLGSNPSETEIERRFRFYYNNSVILNPYINGSATILGVNQLLSEVDNIYNDRIIRIPDPLPSNYPLQFVITLLQHQAAAIRASQKQEISVPDYKIDPGQCIAFKIGALATHKNLMDKLVAVYEVEDQVAVGVTMTHLGVIGGGLLVKGVSAFALPITFGGSTITLYASEPVIWGTVGNVIAYSKAVGALNDITQIATKGAMAFTAVQGNHQAVMDLLMKYQIFSDAGDWLVGVGTLTTTPANNISISSQGSLAIVGITTPNILLSANQLVGTGHGEIVVQNNGGLSINASAIGDIYAALNNNQETIVGMIASDTPIIIPPGQQGTMTFQYHAFRSSLIDSSGYRMSVTVGGIDSTGIPISSAPLSSHFIAGTSDQLSELSKQSFTNPISGQLQAGQPASTYFMTQATTQKVRFDLNGSDGSSFDLHLYDSLGNHTGYKYNEGQAESGIPGSAYSGNTSSPQWISVNQPGSQTYRIVVVAMNNDGGNNFYVSSLETPELPALIDVTPSILLAVKAPNVSIPFIFSINEYGGFSGISNIVCTAGDLLDGEGNIIPANLINLQAPDFIDPGATIVAKGTINLTTIPAAGLYSGTIQITGNDTQTGSHLSGTVKIQFIINWQHINLPYVAH